MKISSEELWMLRLVEQATHLAFVVAQDYRTREVMLFASTGEVLVHHDVSVLRYWLRQYADCGRFGRRCFVDGRQVCRCVPDVSGMKREG